jgi:hypothetical protein
VRSIVFAGARSCLIGFLAASLLNLPAMAAPSPSVGMIVAANHALLSSARATRGVDVYPGDTLATEVDGSLRLASGSSQIYLLASTQTTMLQDTGAVGAKVNHGTVDFSSAPGQFEVQTPLGVVRGDGSGRDFGQVSVLSPTKIQVSAYEGSLLVNGADGVAKSIAAGETYEASLDPAAGASAGPAASSVDPGIQGVGRPRKINWRRVAAVGTIVGGTAIATLLIYDETTESCSKIDCGH